MNLFSVINIFKILVCHISGAHFPLILLLWKFCIHNHELVNRYGISVSLITTDIFRL